MITSRGTKRTTISGGSLAAGASRVAMQSHRASFIADISVTDLERLRVIVRKVHLKHYRKPLPDYAVDRLIEGLAPEVMQKMIKAAVDSKYLK